MNSMLRFLPLVMLMSCANVQSTTLKQDGSKVHRLTCSEFNTSQQECESKARALCTHELKRITHHKEEFPDAGDGIYMYARYQFIVECSG